LTKCFNGILAEPIKVKFKSFINTPVTGERFLRFPFLLLYKYFGADSLKEELFWPRNY